MVFCWQFRPEDYTMEYSGTNRIADLQHSFGKVETSDARVILTR